MKAIVLNQFGEAEHFQKADLPTPKVGRTDVRIKIKACAFNPVDCKIRKGKIPGDLPMVLGIDCSGVVDSVGDQCHEFSKGDEVVAFAFGPCSNGAYAEYVSLPAQFVVHKPKNLSFTDAAAFPLTYLTAFQALIEKGILQENRPFFIAGASGGVGSAALALSKCYRAGPVFTLSGSEKSKEYLLSHFHLPSENIISYERWTQEELEECVIERNQKERFYLAFDCVGGKMKQLCYSICDLGGHLVSILPESEEFELSVWGRKKESAFSRSVSIHMVNLLSRVIYGKEKDWIAYKAQLKQLVKLFEQENMLVPQIEILGSLSVETVQKAHWRMEQGHTQGKLVMNL